MKKVTVKTVSRSYEVIVDSGLLAESGKWLRKLLPVGRVAIITNPTVQKLHGDALERGLTAAGFQPSCLTVPDSEGARTLETAGILYAALNNLQADRSTPVVACGGGVVGDLAGFVAATYKRGLPLVHIPTTLLAQVDSSIGGKTAVDHAGIKNSVGVFYQPVLVLADINVLQTLPEKEVCIGLAEVIKYAVISNAAFFRYLENNMDAIKARDAAALETIVVKSAAIKACIVGKDETDRGVRNLLNFGHTIGHGIESASAFSISHGQAVATGMLIAGKIALKSGTFDPGSLNRLKKLILKAGLEADPDMPPTERITEAVEQDKKIMNGKIRFILPRSIGQAFISQQVDIQMIKAALEGSDA